MAVREYEGDAVKLRIPVLDECSVVDATSTTAETFLFDIDDERTWKYFVLVPEWLQKIINEAQELKNKDIALDEVGLKVKRDESMKQDYMPTDLPF